MNASPRARPSTLSSPMETESDQAPAGFTAVNGRSPPAWGGSRPRGSSGLSDSGAPRPNGSSNFPAPINGEGIQEDPDPPHKRKRSEADAVSLSSASSPKRRGLASPPPGNPSELSPTTNGQPNGRGYRPQEPETSAAKARRTSSSQHWQRSPHDESNPDEQRLAEALQNDNSAASPTDTNESMSAVPSNYPGVAGQSPLEHTEIINVPVSVAPAMGRPATPKQRKRNFANRTKTGCMTCRQRKKKCDERKPTCSNCERGGFECKGYSQSNPFAKPTHHRENPPPLQAKTNGYEHHPVHMHYTAQAHPPPPPPPTAAPPPPPPPPHFIPAPSHYPTVPPAEPSGYPRPMSSQREPHPHRPPHDPNMRPDYGRPPQWPEHIGHPMHPSSYAPYAAPPPPPPPPPPPGYPLPESARPPAIMGYETSPRDPKKLPPPPSLPGSEPRSSSYHDREGSQNLVHTAHSALHQHQLGKMESEKVKMVNQKPFDPSDPVLKDDRHRCKKLWYSFNHGCEDPDNLTESEKQQRFRAIMEGKKDYDKRGDGRPIRPGSVGEDVDVEAPFRCDYGYNIQIGDYTSIGPDCYFMDACTIKIGAGCQVGPGVHIYTQDGEHKSPMPRLNGQKRQAVASMVRIEDDVFIGGRATILKGVKIGKGAVIGAGAIITKDVGPGDYKVADEDLRTLTRRWDTNHHRPTPSRQSSAYEHIRTSTV